MKLLEILHHSTPPKAIIKPKKVMGRAPRPKPIARPRQSVKPSKPKLHRGPGFYAEGVVPTGPLYHVTLTKHVPSIQKKGLLPMQTSNWVKAADKKRYGNGEIYTFEHLADAVRWAAKWDYELTKKLGSGDVSILTLKSDADWDVDDADPISQASGKGRWFKLAGKIDPEAITDAKKFTPDMLKHLKD